jgi:hypothetical protein
MVDEEVIAMARGFVIIAFQAAADRIANTAIVGGPW